MNDTLTTWHIYPVIHFQHSSIKAHNLCTTIWISVFVISLTSSWNRKRDYYAHTAFYMDHFFQPGCMIMPHSERLYVVRVHSICLLHACGGLRFRREFAFVSPKLLPNVEKRSEAKPSQAKPTALGSCFPYFTVNGCHSVVGICVA
jgi:hypothetical protein